MVEARTRKLEITLPANDVTKFIPGGGITVTSSATATTVTGPGGEEVPVTVIAQDEFDAMTEHLENLEALAAYRRTRDEETLSSDMVRRVIDGESPIRIWREKRGLSLRALAKESKVSYSYLSEIENGKKEPAVKTLKALAAVLDLDLDDIV